MEKLLQRQADLLESIKQVERNFKKDSPTRKTREYLDARLETLDKLWAEFNTNNTKLSPFTNEDIDYFNNSQYDQARAYFNEVRYRISSYQQPRDTEQDTIRASESQTGNPGATAPSPITQHTVKPSTSAQTAGDNVEHTQLIRQQRTNFRALARLIKATDVNSISEKWEFEDELRSLQHRWNDIDLLHLKIDHLLQGSDLEYDGEFSYYEARYKEQKRAFYQKMAAEAHLQQATPKLDIPIFSGRYSQWPTFYDLYTESIHNNNILSKCQKMQHLKGKLKGEAERLIQHLNISAENYDTAWELITHRYNNPQVLFTNNIETLLNQNTIHKQTASEIKRLYNTSMEAIHAVRNLGIDISTWDPILVHIITKKLDAETYQDYKCARKSPRELPILSELMDFLENKFTALEPFQIKEKQEAYHLHSQNISQKLPTSKVMNNQHYQAHRYSKFHNKKQYQVIATCTWHCPLCQQKHVLFKCNKFIKLSPSDKLKTVTKLQVCQNCLYKHNDNVCNSINRCRLCKGSHNTILHEACVNNYNTSSSDTRTSLNVQSENHSIFSPTTSKQHNVNYVSNEEEEILLTTLSLKVRAGDGTYITFKALLDQGSQISLISENAAQLLGLSRRHYSASVSGIGYSSRQSKGMVDLDCESIYGDYQFQTQALVISRVINNLPNKTFTKQSWPHLQHLQLADPTYNVCQPVDILLDASVYSDIIMDGLIKGPNRAPIAQQTRLGWILSGNVKTFNCHVVLNNLSDMSHYWELEEINNLAPELTEEDQYCEDLYQNTTRRLSNGRYEVALPMKPGFEQKLGSSKKRAEAQFYKLESRMLNNNKLSQSYIQFMLDYERLGHMKPTIDKQQLPVSCYLPHHGVIKADSTTTKLRTVFNASSRTSTGYSLNHLMERGPNLQKDLHSLILRWRQHKYVITADIEKMYRQIFVRESDQNLQRIVWRPSVSTDLKEYQLTTITYGTKAAPYLAMRTLKQLALDDAQKYPLAAEALTKSFYMDDLLEGHDNLEKARELQLQLINILNGAGMNIRKWSSNNKDLILNLPAEQLDTPLDFKSTESRKTLGLRWNPDSDTFTFQNTFDTIADKRLTKRQLLSNISKIFDPLGWLSPLTIRAKLLFQRTWIDMGDSWDQELTEEIKENWIQLKLDFQKLDKFIIPRYLGNKQTYEIHGFCDASEKAYASAIYITTNYKGENTSRLLTAKTKLAPIKNKLTLPKLELCSAYLLSRLLEKVKDSFKDEQVKIYAWTDSMVVLGWIHGDINRWKQFVANKVRAITKVIPVTCWQHVRTEHNPVDCATRGITATHLIEHPLWWEGPRWLINIKTNLPEQTNYPSPAIEIKGASVNAALHQNDNQVFINKLLNESSSLTRAAVTIAWLSRFIEWLRNKHTALKVNHLTKQEMQSSYNLIIRITQLKDFREDYIFIKTKQHVRKGSRLDCLNPFIDEYGLLRVGGRLNNSLLSPSAKNPIILSSHSRLTELIIQDAHLFTLHGGPRLTLTYIRDKYWIISGLRTVKTQLQKCVKCRRFSEVKQHQLMADLPEPRVTPSRPFTHTGVDFTGHFDIKMNKGRGIRTSKGYVAVFVCLVTKAVHLELVSDLSTQSFLAAFRRFCSRRGTPSHIYSDNGTNFVGANRLLKKEYQQIINTINQDFVTKITEFDIRWHFNAPSFPSAGGLWESAVKRMKYHLKRVVGEQKLTFEEFCTLLHQIEACLNSRPLIAPTEGADDEFLSPGHFLIGGSLLSRPQTEPDFINLTTRWQMVQSMNKHFWNKWSTDYLQELQRRSKWRSPSKNLEIDDVVVIKEENVPPGKWILGKVTEVHPGRDGYVRVVTLKTKNGIIKRPILKLVLLPVKEESLEDRSPTQVSTDKNPNTGHVEQKETERGTRTMKKNCLYNLIMFMLLFMCSIPSANCLFNVTNLNNNQQIYFDKLYNLHLIRDEWKLVVYYNMTTYWTGLRHVQNYVTNLEKSQQTADMTIQYRSILYQLQHELTEIEHYNQILMFHNSRSRQERGLINGVGYIANSLFGVLDDRFLKQYEKDIDKISFNENHLRLLLKNQTSVIEAHNNILHRNEDIMNRQFSLIRAHLKNASLAINRVQAETNNELYYLSSSLSAQIIIANLKEIQRDLLNTITNLWQGHMDAHLLPPEQLENQMNIISTHLPTDLLLPTNQKDINELYKLMKYKAKISNRFMIIEIKLPLLYKETFEVDRPISLYVNGYTTGFLMSYLAFNLQKDLLLTLTDSDLRNCIHTSSDRIICSYDKPILSIQISSNICAVIINNKTLCNTKLSHCEERWIKLHNNNRWLFSCCDKCTLRIFCPGGMEVTTLSGNGLIDIGQGCSIKSETIMIFGHNNFMSSVEINKNTGEGADVSILNHIVNFPSPAPFVPENHDLTWNKTQAVIEDMKDEADTPLSVHDIHQYSMLYTIMLILIIGASLCVIIRWRKRKVGSHVASTASATTAAAAGAEQCAGSAPAPAPRTSISSDSEVMSAVRDMSKISLPKQITTPRSVRLNIPVVSDSE